MRKPCLLSHSIQPVEAECTDHGGSKKKPRKNPVFQNLNFTRNNLTDREPLLHTLTVYSGYNTHRITADGRCKVYTVKKELLDIGKIMVQDNCGNDIPMYDLERTVCDLMRSRNSIEVQEFNSVIKAYVARKDKNLNRLMEYAKLFRVENVIRRYMGVLL